MRGVVLRIGVADKNLDYALVIESPHDCENNREDDQADCKWSSFHEKKVNKASAPTPAARQ